MYYFLEEFHKITLKYTGYEGDRNMKEIGIKESWLDMQNA